MIAARLNAILDSDLWWSFTRSKVVVGAAIVTLALFIAALIAPWIALQDPWDPGSLQLINPRNPPVWLEGGSWEFPLGTDNQGRDMYSAILYGLRVSLVVGFLAVIFAMVLGILLGLASGYFGGMVDTVIMRIADVQLTFPAILIALLIGGIVRGVMTPADFEAVAVYVLVLSIGLSQWVQFARTVRGQTLVEKTSDALP